jgi:hypothetical protein
MTFIGETNYCALVLNDQEFQRIQETQYIFCAKFFDELERSKIISMIIRTTVQIEQLGFLFIRKDNTRLVNLETPIVIHFYIYAGDFYVSMSGHKHGYYSCEEIAFTSILYTIIQDISHPLYRSLASFREDRNDEIDPIDYMKSRHIPVPEELRETPETDAETFEVEEDEEPPYKKRRTETISPLHA